MGGAVHLVQDIFRYIHLRFKLILDCDRWATDSCDCEVCCLREELASFELLCVPERVRLRSSFAHTLSGLSTECFTNSSTHDETSSSDKILCDFSLGLLGTRIWQVCDIQGLAIDVVVLLHDINHFVTAIIDFNHCKFDIFFWERFHLVLDPEAVWRPIWIIVAIVTDIFTMARRVENVECLLDGPCCPFHL